MTTHRINADLDTAAQNIANHLSSAAVLANRIAEIILNLSDEALAAWLNSSTPQETEAMFGAHAMLGQAVNAAGLVASATLVQWGLQRTVPSVDIRPVTEKLTAQWRSIELTESGWIVTRIEQPPIPEQEPEPEQQ